MSTLLSHSLDIAPSQLYVRDLPTMTRFYQDTVGLEVLESSKTSILLGHNHTGVIELIEKTKLRHASPKSAGLFHNAILFDSQGTLSRTVGKLLTASPELFSGTGDHLVSEAFYFNDPENNGVELYYDRPASMWQWHNGQIVMDTLYIDPVSYVNQYASSVSTSNKKLGHIHLRVGDIDQSRSFYVSLLGFNITADLGSALFVSVAGYHHHIGLNTWLSQGAGVRPPSLGLANISISLGQSADVDQLAVRLEHAQYPFIYSHGQLQVSDPWGNAFNFSAT